MKVTRATGYSDALSLVAVLVLKLEDEKRRALAAVRIGSRIYKRWIPQNELLMNPGDYREKLVPAAAGVLVRAPNKLLFAESLEDAEEMLKNPPKS